MIVRDGLARLGPECQEILDRFFARDESYRTIGDALDDPGRHDREQDLPLPRTSPGRARTMTEEITRLPRRVDMVIE